MIKIGWIDFNNDDREKAMSVIDLMKDKIAVDELGIGKIRDRLADLLFPGTSTIQTRAKYFFIIPWCIMEAEKNFKDRKAFVKKLNKLETNIIYKLIENEDKDAKGIIGKESKEKLKRRPSSIYWNGLKTYDIMPLKLSFNQYIDKLQEDKNRGNNIEDKSLDDKDSNHLDNGNSGWNIELPQGNWSEDIRLKLTMDESNYLKDAIIRSNKESLYSYILENNLREFTDKDSLYELPFENKLPENIKKTLRLALDFGLIIDGAHIRFNIMLREKNKVDYSEYEEQWNDWCNKIKKFNWSSFDKERLFRVTNTDGSDIETFVESWIKIAINIDNIDLQLIDKLIENREYVLKGPRAKLKNYSKVNLDNRVGLGLLNYRWRNVRTIINDINEGGKENA